MTGIIIIVIIVLLAVWFISAQRKLVKLDEFCKNGLSQIGVQQASRWDALKALAELTKSYSDYEYKAITDIIAQRRSISGASQASEANQQEKLLSEAMGHINVVAEQYPELKASETYVKTMDSVNTYENQVRMSRMVYNDSVTKYNNATRQFPDSIAASVLHFSAREYLVENVGKESMPSMKL